MLTPDLLHSSVIAVPPLARRPDLSFDPEENTRLIRYLEDGGIRTLLYGGNANLYHISLHHYAELLAFLSGLPDDSTTVIPSVGPAFGTMLEQARILKDYAFPSVMVLPPPGISTPRGVSTGIQHFVSAYGKPVVLYIKQDGVIDVPRVKALVDDGLVAAIKYAIVRTDPANDEYLEQLVSAVDPGLIVSGMGEQPTLVHFHDFGLRSFTSGCVCVAPALSMAMLQALHAGNRAKAENIRRLFEPLEDLRNAHSPIRVLHEAVALAGLARTGPVYPLLSNLEPQHHPAVQEAAMALKEHEMDVQSMA